MRQSLPHLAYLHDLLNNLIICTNNFAKSFIYICKCKTMYLHLISQSARQHDALLIGDRQVTPHQREANPAKGGWSYQTHTVMEFKGTKGKLQKVYVTDVCIGIGVVQKNGYTEMTANSILPDVEELSDKQIKVEMKKLEADMTLYAHAPEMLEMLAKIEPMLRERHLYGTACDVRDLLTRATTI